MPRRSTVIARPLRIFVPGWGSVTTVPPAAKSSVATARVINGAQAPNRKLQISNKHQRTNLNDGNVAAALVLVIGEWVIGD
jgi:hypothetical protein